MFVRRDLKSVEIAKKIILIVDAAGDELNPVLHPSYDTPPVLTY